MGEASFSEYRVMVLIRSASKELSILGDGFVEGSPNNDKYNTRTVTNGVITPAFTDHHVVIRAGLPYLSDIETLDLETTRGETQVDKKKLIGEVTVFLEKSRGIWAGSEPPVVGVAANNGLFELKIRNTESYQDPVALLTGKDDVKIQSRWDRNGRVFIRQIEPLPMTVLAIAPKGYFPSGRK